MENVSENTQAPIESTEATEVVETSTAPTSTETSFIDSLSPELKGEESLKSFKDVESLAKSYINAQKMIGGSVRIPGEDAGEEQLKEFYSKLDKVPGVMRRPDSENPEAMEQFYASLGRPSAPEEYKIEAPEGINIEDSNLNERLAEFKEQAHSLGLSQEQASMIAASELEKYQGNIQVHNKQVEEANEFLKQSWGMEYEDRVQSVRELSQVFKEKYPEKFINDLMGSNNPIVLSMMSELAQSYKEKGHKGITTTNFGTSREEALEQISEIRNNKAHPYHNAGSPDNATAKAKMDRLYNLAYSE